MKIVNALPVVRRWRYMAAVVGVGTLVGGGVLIAAPADSSPAQAFHGVTTVRVLDTREGTGTRLGSGASLDLIIPGLPDDATSVSVNLTVVDGTEGSFLTVYPTGEARPTTSSINWDSSAAVANSATIRIGASHSVSIYNLKGTVNVVMDLLGYYAPAPAGGTPGATGATGQHGADGVDGQRGAQGPQGPQGVASPPTQPLYFYASNAAAETVVLGAAVRFGQAGLSSPPSPGGIVVNGPGSTFSVPTAGVYTVTFAVTAIVDNQLSVQVNGIVASLFGAEAHTPGIGTAVVALSAGDVLTIVNSTTGPSAGSLDLDGSIGGTSSAINAWIMIQRVS